MGHHPARHSLSACGVQVAHVLSKVAKAAAAGAPCVERDLAEDLSRQAWRRRVHDDISVCVYWLGQPATIKAVPNTRAAAAARVSPAAPPERAAGGCKGDAQPAPQESSSADSKLSSDAVNGAGGAGGDAASSSHDIAGRAHDAAAKAQTLAGHGALAAPAGATGAQSWSSRLRGIVSAGFVAAAAAGGACLAVRSFRLRQR